MNELSNNDKNNHNYKRLNRHDKNNFNDLELENLETIKQKEEEKQVLMVYKDFYEINYQDIHNFHKKV
jgi:hypothetical protein